ncbi:MAG: guanylate kinase [Gemmatimonadetes bacterium]|uniref:Guanylate kinase n=1 Tax=Candidatus Kutchimonas denitrificans TaxID=3056748 RepID=A0AAE4Z8W9_9BACT|nr:guanylate kinase [Gemmatimonadota bacterium]NIR75178.1 guanylate kinase [Candidatus Kutchimonas denitrificans]NIS00116.1 guanylate kinase [Gemmatimonadota bacterium]NIT65708.1 guanylate kinase [Gemmatimonadota bacterium]NIU52986.1 guanylate kinase [Gemmatimonadota bacterium]
MSSFPVAICAPSGAGKTTVCRALLEASDDLLFSVSATTRPPRQGERDGVDYHFVSDEEFRDMAERGALLEWAEVHGRLYGTPRSNLEAAEREGKKLVLDIDVQGARQVVKARSDTVTVFLLPPSFAVLMERLRGRGSEKGERLRRRMETARGELDAAMTFQYVVVNDRLDEAVAAVRSILDGEGWRLERRREEIEARVGELRAGLEAGTR